MQRLPWCLFRCHVRSSEESFTMKFVWVLTVPLGVVVLFIMGVPSMLNVEQKPSPENVILNDKSDYQSKAEDYAQLDMRQEALATCASMQEKYGDQDLCLLEIYGILDDIDGQIEVYEKMLARNIADGDSASAASKKRRLESLREERDKKK